MHIQWYGQSAFRLTAPEATVFIDPFTDMAERARGRGMQFDYPPIQDVSADLVLVTHEHFDHNGVQAIDGSPEVLRSTAGRLSSKLGEVVAVASEHDAAAGTERGPNTIFVFTLDGIRVAHFGDFGQTSLREEQAEAIGTVDMLIVPVGAGPTVGPKQAHEICERLDPRWVVPMHYRTSRVNFLEPVDPFLKLAAAVHRLDEPWFETAALPSGDGLVAVVPATP